MNEGRTGFPATTTTDRALRTIVFVASGSGRTNAQTYTHRDKWYEWYDVIRLSHIPCIQIIYLTGRSQEFKTINYQIVLFVIVFCALRPVLGIQCPVSPVPCVEFFAYSPPRRVSSAKCPDRHKENDNYGGFLYNLLSVCGTMWLCVCQLKLLPFVTCNLKLVMHRDRKG